ncbi:hypothetical protein LMG27198_45960 [Methylocystis echinoides]|uniref:Uncharacterized protein n=1 Tax=Methylocystis echinoides TaxID=29468 RepID=A0A9W6LUL3_9HYPH|nr:hypothetical protein LMG27198_45960 [Methylocystis echinoides]
MTEYFGAARHSGEAEIGGVGEQRRHQPDIFLGRRAGAKMTETLGESCPAIDFGEKLGDPQARQHAIEPARDIFYFIVLILADRTDRQPLRSDGRFDKLACRCECIDFLEPRFKQSSSLGAPVIEAIRDGKSQFAFLSPCDEGLWRQKKIAEGAERGASLDPNISGPQTVA